MRHQLTFRSKLFLMFLTSTLLPVVLIFALMTAYFNNVLTKQSKSQYENMLLSLSQNISAYVENMTRLSLSPHLYDDIMNFYMNVRSGLYYENPYVQFSSGKNYSVAMQQLLILTPKQLLGVCFLSIDKDKNDCFVEYKKNNLSGTVTDYDYKEKPWYVKASKSDGRVVFVPVHKVSYYYGGDRQVFSVVRMVLNVYTKYAIGMIKVDSDEAVFDEIFGRIQVNPDSALLLFDDENAVLYNRGADLAALVPGIETNGQTLTGTGDHYRVYLQSVPGTPWKLAYLSSSGDMLLEIATFMVFLLLILLLVTLLALIMYRINSRRMEKHVRSIIQTMQQVESGDLHVKTDLQIHSTSEFNLISRQLDKMVKSLNDHIDSEYRAVINQKNAEYLALQTQINPHFLYNVLNSFVSLNRLGDKKLLEKSIMKLTKLFRYTCSNANNSTVEDEFAFVEKYLSLQKLRFEERMDFSIEMEEAARGAILPKMLIQPLVENAIKHGMEPVDCPVLIEINAALHKDAAGRWLKIYIKDNGAGFDVSVLGESKRVGLANVEERLQLFNPNCRFEIKSEPGLYTVCQVFIPRALAGIPLRQVSKPLVHTENLHSLSGSAIWFRG